MKNHKTRSISIHFLRVHTVELYVVVCPDHTGNHTEPNDALLLLKKNKAPGLTARKHTRNIGFVFELFFTVVFKFAFLSSEKHT